MMQAWMVLDDAAGWCQAGERLMLWVEG